MTQHQKIWDEGSTMKTANRLYKLDHFWRHDDESTDEEM